MKNSKQLEASPMASLVLVQRWPVLCLSLSTLLNDSVYEKI
jgi:hypothetical protein